MKLRATCLAIVLALGCVHSARAAPPPLTPDPVPSATTTAPTPPPPPDPQAKEKSRAAFRRGVAQIKAQDWTGARASFEEAWSLVQHPSILLNLGISRLKTGDPVLAEQDLTKFLQEDSGAAPDELASARDALAEARSKIGTLRVIATPPTAAVKIDGNLVNIRSNDGVAEARMKPGSHTVNVDAEGYTSVEKTVDVVAKSDAEVKIALVANGSGKPAGPDKTTEPQEGTNYRPIAGYALAGLGGVALVTSGIMGLRAISLSSSYGDKTDPGFQKPDTKSEGITFRTGADVALIIALLAGTGAVLLLFTDVGKDPDGAPAPKSTPPATAQLPALFRW